mmetsp:Transcript_4162/g.9343  ORF Transcript_4162/g.9343 Transcript_4162/m.9343 type:complete len:609 (-) Transcript_4162:253-2079(-)
MMTSRMRHLKKMIINSQSAKHPRVLMGCDTIVLTKLDDFILSRRTIATSTSSTSKASTSAIPTTFSTSLDASTVDPDNHDGPTLAHRAPSSPSRINFSDSVSAHGSKTTLDLFRAIAVFKACQLEFLVKHAEALLNASRTLLGSTLTNSLVKYTFFRHFCAGENSADMKPVIHMLEQNNIGPILDYAAESEGGKDDDAISDGEDGIFTQPPFNQPARVYDYKSEKDCDRHVQIFKKCIRSVRDVSPTHGFAALKVTALGNPELLERMSTVIVEVKNLFSKFDRKGTGLICREDFIHCYEKYFYADDQKLTKIIRLLDPNNTGMIDCISFSQLLTPCKLPNFTQKCKEIGPLALATPSSDEIILMKAMRERLHTLAKDAVYCGTKLLIDAEHAKYQPAIDNLVLELQQKYNARDRTERPFIFNTYQCYLKDSAERITTDLKRSERFSFHFAAKLVRGAYMVHERERAKKNNLPSPIHDTAENTHRCYDEVIELLLRHRARHGPGLEIMIATHNKESIERAVSLMSELDIGPSDESVHFAQLYGMSDNLTFTLGNHGYNAFKYLPYGEVQEVVPYLVRRAQENGDMLGNAGTEVSLLLDELRKRYSYQFE